MMPITLRADDAHVCIPGAEPTLECDALLTDVARRVAEMRRSKKSILSSPIFVEPAWDMMLDLFVAQNMERDIGLTSVAMASGVPLSTALRHLKVIEMQKLVKRYPDEKDGRVCNVRLTEKGINKMRNILQMAIIPLDREARKKVRV